ncbi:hypothetical protein TPHA_0D01160 [Tetrapisispora phaffii CBS 4417]|uniref:Ribosome biogenesis protein NOP53 n=1 Tax=Tetrapisispora phaffii (strain ATCC 24235 / CBS 4417 / NBRC 1672 / NRRL Y-8282 / UCD 70-5) TaxID=1071381 RepID=G8BSD6_TETPH|nr:hypothetical protein TPHA_0D01160 [Tetrapisispora phaffii CBS 4417]CCE62757.1 hypothetical protein TPHA_0D01160 [Tetrapisispora phaffii CBS 4417]
MAPSTSMSRPSQYKQSSRKGKKAWRKNIDLSDIEKAVAEKNEFEISHGTKDLSDLKDDTLFAVDTVGNTELKEKLIKRKQIKKNLKSREILDAIQTNSKVPALNHPRFNKSSNENSKKNKIQGVSKKEISRLMAMAGRVQGESVAKNMMAKDGLIKSGTNDLWGDEPKKKISLPSGIELDSKLKDQIPEELLNQSTTSWSKPTTKPVTMDLAPIQVKEFADMPHAGKSYNPNTKDWENLISNEFDKEMVKEEKRVALEEYRARISHLIEVLDDNEEESSDEDENENTKEVSADEEDEEDLLKLSVNPVVRNKKKTKQQRNKAKKHQEKVRLQEELKKLREQVRKLEDIESLNEDVEIDDQLKNSLKENAVNAPKMNKRNRLGTKYSVIEASVDVKFKDELSDSLRKLRPEGNLLYDTVRKLQSTGKLEARVRKTRPQRKNKITEKWTYKDFK